MAGIPLDVPESLQHYHRHKTHSAAIDQVISKKGKAEADFDWETLDLFYQSHLSAEITRYDNWRFLLDANRLVWGEAVRNFAGRFKECEPSFYAQENTIQNAWDEQCLYLSLVPGADTRILEGLLGCWLDGSHMRLWMWFRDNNDSYPSNNWKLGENWDVKSHEWERHTAWDLKTDAVDLSKQDTLDLSGLKAAADDAIKVAKENI